MSGNEAIVRQSVIEADCADGSDICAITFSVSVGRVERSHSRQPRAGEAVPQREGIEKPSDAIRAKRVGRKGLEMRRGKVS